MKKVISAGLACVALLLLLMPISVSATEDAQNRSYSCYSLDATESVLGTTVLTDNADTAVIYELNSNTMMYAVNPDEVIEPASLVKIMTCLIAAEKGVMDDAVTIKAETISSIPEDAANVGLQADEVLSLEQLMYCMMISSANDAAAVIAEHIAGSQEAFIGMMNDYAERIGCTNTHFTNVHGLYDVNQFSTARDLTKILYVATQNETFNKFFGADYYELPPTNKSDVRYLLTSNYLLSKEDVEIYYDERVTGGRTGITRNYDRSVAVSAEAGNMQLLCVITGAASQVSSNGYSVTVFGGYQEVSLMLDACFNGYHVAQVVFDGQIVTQQPVDNGDCDVILGARATGLAVVPEYTKISDLTYSLTSREALVAPIEKGQPVSSVDIWHNNVCIAQAQLYAMNTVRVQNEITDKPINQELTKSGGNGWIILLVICLLFVIVFFTPRVLKLVRRQAIVKRVRRNQSYRRKSR